MAIYHATVKVFSRARGSSALAAAAYRAGTRIVDSKTGTIYDYSARSGVVSVAVIAPPIQVPDLRDIGALWNAAESAETRVNSRVARELEVSLPAELNATQRRALSHTLAQMLVSRYGVAVMAAIHEPGKGGDSRNHHVHLLMTTRVLGPTGFGKKVRILDDQKTGPVEIASLRSMTADLINRHLEAAGRSERVDHRTLSEQAGGAAARGDIEGVGRLCRLPGIHHGKAATAMLRRGLASDRATGAKRPASSPASRSVRPRLGRTPTIRTTLGDTGVSLRAHGADARLLNEQATLIQKGLRRSRDSLRVYLEGLSQAAREAEEWMAPPSSIASHTPKLRSSETVVHQPVRHPEPVPDSIKNAPRSSPARNGSFLTRRQWAERRRQERAAVLKPTPVVPPRQDFMLGLRQPPRRPAP